VAHVCGGFTCREHGLTPFQEECGNPTETHSYSSLSLSLTLVMGLLSIQDFYLSGQMYRRTCISTWYPIPSHPSLRLSRYLSHIITQRHHFSTYRFFFFKVEIFSPHFHHSPSHILDGRTAELLTPQQVSCSMFIRLPN